MFDDRTLARSADAALSGIAVPPLPLEAILHKMHAVERPRPPHRMALVRLAIAAAAVLGILAGAYPATSVAVIQGIEARYRAALQALGGTAPPPVPDALVKSLRVRHERVTVAQARSRAPFTLVPPSGLPHDVTQSRIELVGTGVYVRTTHTWSKAGNAVTFDYTRSGGRRFQLLADKYDPRNGLPGKYMFEAKDPGPDGRPVLVRHLHFAWRNGDQMMSAIADAGISANEILAIEHAMHGVPLQLRDLHMPQTGSRSKVYVVP